MTKVMQSAAAVPESGVREIAHFVLDRPDEDVVRLGIGDPGPEVSVVDLPGRTK